jgi:hypothetical protein
MRNRDWTGVSIGLAIAAAGALITLISVVAVSKGGVGVVFIGAILFGLWKAAKSFATVDADWVDDDARTRAEREILRNKRQDDHRES